jgi:asparagine synthase (glutamine-hydrolysing)
MELAHRQGIKVVLDGQGADELFAGYHHHFVASWNNLLKRGRVADAFKGLTTTGKSIPDPFSFYMREKMKEVFDPHRIQLGHFFRHDYLTVYKKRKFLDDVNEQLVDDIYNTRLKSFLKCEDRCGMWHSVESRTPFSDDVNLINLLFSFNGNKKIKNGISKYLLREAVKDQLPQEIYRRFDKKGFETPMQDWMRSMRPTLISEISAMNFSFLKKGAIEKTDPRNAFQNKMLFRLFVLARWHRLFTA